MNPGTTRRSAMAALAASLAGVAGRLMASAEACAANAAFEFRWMLPSCMYGKFSLAEIFPESKAIGATAVDLWPLPHGNQREQLDELGEDALRSLLGEYSLTLGCLTQYRLGPFGLQEEMQLAQRFGCTTIVTGARGPKGLKGDELKAAIAAFIEQMKPHLEAAEETGVTIAIENHGNNLLESSDAMRWLAEMRPSEHLAVAVAPYHLPQDSEGLAQLIRDLGPAVEVFYAWQHGMGCMQKLPKEQELMQMPGRGKLDFGPIVRALADIDYSGWTEIFMHPVPRGIPILETVEEVTAEINQARHYLEGLS